MKRLLAWFCILLCFSACREDHSSSGRLSSFKGFPPGISGCSCYFSQSDKDFRGERFIFVTDLDSTAFVSVDGKLIRLKLLRSTREPNVLDGSEHTDTFSNGVYTVTAEISPSENTGDEVWWNTGKLTLYFKDVEIETLPFLGECGC